MTNTLFFLVEANFKLVLGHSNQTSHCKVNLYNIYRELHQVSIEIKLALEDKAIQPLMFNTTENVR